MRPGQSSVFDSAQQSAQIRMFRRLAFGSQDSSSFYNESQSSWRSRDQNSTTMSPQNKSGSWNVWHYSLGFTMVEEILLHFFYFAGPGGGAVVYWSVNFIFFFSHYFLFSFSQRDFFFLLSMVLYILFNLGYLLHNLLYYGCQCCNGNSMCWC